VKIPWQVGILKSTKKTSKQNFWHRRQILLDYKTQLENVILVLMWLESYQEIITRVIEYFGIFPMVTCTPWYDQLFGSYNFWKSTRSLKFCFEQIRAFWEFCNHDHNSKVIMGNFHCQHHIWLSLLSGGYSCASIWLTIQKLRSFKVVGTAENFYLNQRK
jgi:hypothetical protein